MMDNVRVTEPWLKELGYANAVKEMFDQVCKDALGYERGTSDIALLRARLTGQAGKRRAARLKDFKGYPSVYPELLASARNHKLAADEHSHVTKPEATPGQRVNKGHLERLKLDSLRELCDRKDVNVSGNKTEVIKRLIDVKTTYDDLIVDDLKEILRELHLPVTGTKSTLISKLQGSPSPIPRENVAKKDSFDPPPKKTASNKPSMFERMTPQQYRKRMGVADPSLIQDDTHVCHIIAKANKGADAGENFILLNGALNTRLGAKGDHVMVYLVGIHKALQAVGASQELCDYTGPSAQQLYKKGEAFFRNHFGAQTRLDDNDPQDRIREAQKLLK